MNNLKFGMKSTSGFSLIEVLFAVGVLGIISYGLAGALENFNRQQVYIDTKTDRTELRRNLESMFERQISCSANLLPGYGPTPSYILTSLNQVSDSGVILTGIVPGLGVPVNATSKLQVSNIAILGPGATGSPQLLSTTALKKTYLADLKITFGKPAGGGIVLQPLVLTSIRIDTTLADVFIGCQIKPIATASALCLQLGLYWDGASQECLPSGAKICSLIGGVMSAGVCIPSTMLGMNCPTGEVVTGFYPTGKPVCAVSSSGGTSPPPLTCTDLLLCRCFVISPIDQSVSCNMTNPLCYEYQKECK